MESMNSKDRKRCLSVVGKMDGTVFRVEIWAIELPCRVCALLQMGSDELHLLEHRTLVSVHNLIICFYANFAPLHPKDKCCALESTTIFFFLEGCHYFLR